MVCTQRELSHSISLDVGIVVVQLCMGRHRQCHGRGWGEAGNVSLLTLIHSASDGVHHREQKDA